MCCCALCTSCNNCEKPLPGWHGSDSAETATGVDEEVIRILDEAFEEAKRLLNENRELMDELAAFLLEKESITGKEFMKIFNRAKGIADEENTDKEDIDIEDTDKENSDKENE